MVFVVRPRHALKGEWGQSPFPRKGIRPPTSDQKNARMPNATPRPGSGE